MVSVFHDDCTAKGMVMVTRYDPNGRVLGVDEICNHITDGGLSAIAYGKPINYFSWGTGTTAPANTDTKLANEQGRKAILKHITGATGVDTVRGILEMYEAADMTIAELGFWADATSARDTGILVARVLYSRVKTGAESWQIDRKLTILRA